MEPRELSTAYSWLLSQYFTLLVTDHPDPEEVLRILVPHPEMGPCDPNQANTWRNGRQDGHASVIEAVPMHGSTVVIDELPGRLSSEDLLGPLSIHSKVAMLNNPPNSAAMFDWWVDGALQRRTYPESMTELDAPAFVGAALPEESDLPFERTPGLGMPSAVHLIERLTGVSLSLDDLQQYTGIAVGMTH